MKIGDKVEYTVASHNLIITGTGYIRSAGKYLCKVKGIGMQRLLLVPTCNIKLVRVCVVCGARVRNQNPKCFTCDAVCTAARKAGRSRGEQLEHEIKQMPWGDMPTASARAAARFLEQNP